jgi:hypothetical protein
MTSGDDVYPDGTIIHRKVELIGVTTHVAYIKSRGEWYMTAGHPIPWDELAMMPSYATVNHYELRLPRADV